MIKTIILFIRKVDSKINQLLTWLERKYDSPNTETKFVDLAPTEQADKDNIYSNAIQFAIKNDSIFNIALTGPYSAGKSSIIRSFLKKHPHSAFTISLATFVDETSPSPTDDEKANSTTRSSKNKKVNRQEIERSILQQMLYGADAHKLPLSRFKRIQSPSRLKSIIKSLFIMLGSLSLWYMATQLGDITNGSFFTPISFSNILNLGAFTLGVIFLWVIIYKAHIASFNLMLKKISLRDIEIKSTSNDPTSILNRYLDEIIYFFQSTNYEIVIIEDLDRFNDTEIFITLREINSLVNRNAGIEKPIKFLYALRDDMFINTDRTKFFEFIIPVVPIINASNSIDMVLKHGRRLELHNELDPQFLRDVSRYLDDLRLIQNIFNEYAIYTDNIKTDEKYPLDANKLLAVLIYKNAYPKDFEDLHRGEGHFSEILDKKDLLIKEIEADYKTKIEELETQIEIAKQTTAKNLRELRSIYVMALIKILPQHAHAVRYKDEKRLTFSQLIDSDSFEKFITAKELRPFNYSGQIINPIDTSNLEEKVDSEKTYQQRKEEIETREAQNRNKILQQIKNLKIRLAELPNRKLNKLLLSHPAVSTKLFKNFPRGGELARFLILEGYLDDNYYQYTSLFHSGRLSPNDNNFLIQIRAFTTPEPNFLIDNPKEVIAAMRDEDFRQSYALNVKIVDTMLQEQTLYSDEIENLFEFISLKFEDAESFFQAYYFNGQEVTQLLTNLTNQWAGFIPAALESSYKVTHITQLVSDLPINLLEKNASKFSALSKSVASNLPEILINLPQLPPKRLKALDINISNFAAIEEHSEVVNFMFEEGLYDLTIKNLEYIYQEILGQGDAKPMRTQNYTTIRSLNNHLLKERVESNFELYFDKILLKLPKNTEESVPSILEILQKSTLDIDALCDFLEKQTTQLPNLVDVPNQLQALLFQLNKIEPSWENCLAFIESEEFDADTLIEYLEIDSVRTKLVQKTIPIDLNTLQLQQFLVRANSLSDPSYKDYVGALPRQIDKIPNNLEQTKLQMLIEERKVEFTKENFEALKSDNELQILFSALNIEAYLTDPSNFKCHDLFLEKLLQENIENKDKLRVIKLMDLKALADHPKRAAIVGPILDTSSCKDFDLDGPNVQILVSEAKPIETQISLLNKFHSFMTAQEVRNLLIKLQKPYSEIRTGHKRPKLEKNIINKNLVEWLKERKFISSWTEEDSAIFVNLFRKRH